MPFRQVFQVVLSEESDMLSMDEIARIIHAHLEEVKFTVLSVEFLTEESY